MRWRLVAGGVVAGLAVVGFDGAVAVWAQDKGRAEAALGDYPFYDYSLTKHLVAMLVLAAFTVGVATALARAGHRLLALLTVVGVVAGPMAVIAAPVDPRLMAVSYDETVAWWRLLVGTPQALVLVAATAWFTRWSPAPEPTPARDHRRDTALFFLVTAVAATFQIVTSRGIEEEPALVPVLGWAVLAAAVAVLGRPPSPDRAAPLLLVGGAASLTALHLAYSRDGGWPGVAGWETYGQSPVVLSWATPVVLLAIPVLVVAGRSARALRQAQRPAAGTAGELGSA